MYVYLNRMTMAYKAHNAVKKHLKEKWEAVCNGYLLELLNMWETDSYYGYWVSDEIGGTYIFSDENPISIDEIIFAVENDVEYETYIAWIEYVCFAHEYGQTIPNFQSWCKGCPRLSESEQQRLRDLKRDFESAVKDYKERTDKKNNGLF